MKEKTNKIIFPIPEIEEKLGYRFKNKKMLLQAFTRSSYSAEEKRDEDNEVLEFIGDSIVGMLVVKTLTSRYASNTDPFETDGNRSYCCELDERELSELKIEFVRRSSLAAAIGALGLERYLLTGKGDIKNNIIEQESVKEDLFEALVGAVAKDCDWNMEIIEKTVNNLLDVEAILEHGRKGDPDYVGKLEDWLKRHGVETEIEVLESNICKNLKYMARVDLGMDMLYHKAYGFANTEGGAKLMAARRALDFIKRQSKRTYEVFHAVGNPDRERAINQLQELYQKKIIPEPKYVFTKQGIAETGNPQWKCSCTIGDIYDSNGGYVCASKIEAKKATAFEALNYLLGRDLSQLFMQ